MSPFLEMKTHCFFGGGSESESESSEDELSRVRSITSAFLVELGSAGGATTAGCRTGVKAEREKGENQQNQEQQQLSSRRKVDVQELLLHKCGTNSS